MSDHAFWSGLGQRAGAPSPAPVHEEQDPNFARDSVQRTIPAAGAPSVIAPGARTSAFDHPYQPPAGSVDASDDDSAAEPEGKTMTSKPEGGRVRNVQLRICRAIDNAGGSILRTELAKALSDLNTKQLSQGIFLVTGSSRVQKHMTDTGWTLKLTRAGVAYLNAQGTSEGAAPAPAKKPTRRKAQEQKSPPAKATRKKPKTRRAAVRVQRPQANVQTTEATPARAVPDQLALSQPAGIQVVQERSFRCAVFSDGGFFLAKGDQKVELTAAEHREMLRYQERMCEPSPGASA